MTKLTSPSEIDRLMRRYDLRFHKRFGQNFLIDENVLNRIVEAADISSSDAVLEIGSGIGTLTCALASLANKVTTVEIDTRLISVLNETLSEYPNIKITNNIYIVILFFIIVAIASTFNHSDFIHMKTIEIIPYCIFALVGIYATLSFSSIISKRKTFITKCLVYIGNNTLYILTWHIFAFDIFSLFYLKVIAQRPFNSIEEEYLFLNLGGIYIICYVLLGITIPLLIKVLFNYKNIRHWLHIN